MPHWLKKHPEFLVATGFFFVLVLVRLISGFNGLYGQDAHEYLRYTRALFDYFHGGSHPGAFFWPLNYPLAGVSFAHILGTGPICLQLVSLLALPGSFLYIALLSKQQASQPGIDSTQPNYSLLFPALFLLLSPYLLRGAFLVMSDMQTLFLICATLYHLYRYGTAGRSRDFLLGAGWIGLAVFTRYPAGLLLLPMAIAFCVFGVKYRDWKAGLIALPLALLVLLPQAMLRAETPFHFLENGLLQHASPLRIFQRSYDAPDGYFSYLFPNGLFVLSNLFHPGYLFAGILLLPFFRKQDLSGWFSKLILVSWLLYIVFIGMLPFQNSRFLIISFPLVLILLYPAFGRGVTWLTSKTGPKLVKLGLVGALLFQLALFAYSSRSHYQLYTLEHRISNTFIEKYAGPTLYTFYIDGALKTYEVDNPIVNLWEQDLTGQSLASQSLVLFNEERFAVQWEGKNPMKNWAYLNREYQLAKLEDFGEGWMLYELR